MSAESFRHVLVILSGEPEDYGQVLARAVELAEVEHARLTLAKTRDSTWLSPGVCVFPLVAVPPAVGLAEHARDVLSRSAELIPQSVSLTTLLLGDDTCLSLRRLLGRGDYDLVVADEGFLHRSRRLRRLLHRAGISTLAVSVDELGRPVADAPVQPCPAPATQAGGKGASPAPMTAARTQLP